MQEVAAGQTAPDDRSSPSLNAAQLEHAERRERLKQGIAADRAQLVDYLRGVRHRVPEIAIAEPSDTDLVRRIVLIEDNEVDAKVTRTLLQMSGLGELRIDWFMSLAAATTHLRQGIGEVILLDLGLPDGQGSEVVHAVRQLAPATPIVVLSGKSDEAIAVQSLQEGAQDYVVKGTLDAPGLGRTVRLALTRAESERSLRLSLVKLLLRSDELADEVRRRGEVEDRLREEQVLLSETIAQLKRANEAKTEFLANVSHELRTPLTSIIGYSDILVEEIGEQGSALTKSAVEVVARNSQRLLMLVEDLLITSELDSTQMHMTRERVNLVQVVETVIETIQLTAQAKSQDLSVSLRDTIPLVWGDRRQLERVLFNVVGNAIKFTPPGGSVGVNLQLLTAENAVEITTTDNGPGIRAGDLEDLFTPFARGTDAVASEVPGTGLGLGIVKSIIDAHRGELSVTSEVGRGTSVSFRVPVDLRLTNDDPSNDFRNTYQHPTGVHQ